MCAYRGKCLATQLQEHRLVPEHVTLNTLFLAELSTFYTHELDDLADDAMVGVAFGLFVFVPFGG